VAWSFRLARVGGIDLRVHLTFGLVLIWAALAWGAETGLGMRGALFGVAATLLLFASVVVHELAHAAVARCYGIPVEGITLWPIGGVASIARQPERPAQALWLAAAGPLASVGVAIAVWLLGEGLRLAGWLASGWAFQALGRVSWSGLLAYLVAANLGVAAFNLIPALPLDGGRVLRAVLAMPLGPDEATRWAVRVAHLLAWLMGLVGLVGGNVFLIVIAFLVYAAAGVEGAASETKRVLGDLRVAQAMSRPVATLAPVEPLSRAVELTLGTPQADFPVVEGGRLVGLLSQRDLVAALADRGPAAPVGAVVRTDLLVLPPGCPLAEAEELMVSAGVGAAPVVDGGMLVGLLTRADVREAYLLTSASRRPADGHRGARGRSR
jgi:Zn-dependent protease/predicted transcriptional regulator